MICHTVCTPERCKNFNECRNNIQYFQEKNNNRLCIKVNKLHDRGLYVRDIDFEKGEFIAMYNGLVNVYDAPQTSNFVMNISPRYSIDAANPLDSTIPVCLAGFINHGCRSAANAFTRIVNTGSELVVAVYTLKAIPKDTEIRFDYAASSPNERSAMLSKLEISKCNCSECSIQSTNRASKRIKNQKPLRISSSEDTSTSLLTNINLESKDSSPLMVHTTLVDQQSPGKSGSHSDWIQISHTKNKREKQLSRKSQIRSLQLLHPYTRDGLSSPPCHPSVTATEGDIKILSNTKALSIVFQLSSVIILYFLILPV